MSRPIAFPRRATPPHQSARRRLPDSPPLFEALEPRQLLTGVGIATGLVAWVPQTTSDVSASAGASGTDPGATGSGTAGTGTTGPGTVVTPGNGTAVGTTIHAAAGTSFTGELGQLEGVTLPSGVTLHSSIDWGDGTDASTATITRDSAGVYHVSGTHTYAFGGTYDIAVYTTGSPTAAP